MSKVSEILSAIVALDGSKAVDIDDKLGELLVALGNENPTLPGRVYRETAKKVLADLTAQENSETVHKSLVPTLKKAWNAVMSAKTAKEYATAAKDLQAAMVALEESGAVTNTQIGRDHVNKTTEIVVYDKTRPTNRGPRNTRTDDTVRLVSAANEYTEYRKGAEAVKELKLDGWDAESSQNAWKLIARAFATGNKLEGYRRVEKDRKTVITLDEIESVRESCGTDDGSYPYSGKNPLDQ